jgi:hypothetical protein
MSRRAIAEWRLGLLVYGLSSFRVLGPATGCGLMRVLGRASDAGTVCDLVGVGRGLCEDEGTTVSSECSGRKMALKTAL